MSVIVRFAPSPTGMLHIGNVRTAVFNYLFARHHNGKFLLRIEDTDQERSTEPAVEAIFDGLKWLGLDYDGDAIFQSSRVERHKELAESLLKNGHAYRCFCDEDEIERLRYDSRSDNEKIIYPDRDQERFLPDEKPFTIRLKTPLSGELTIDDVIRGQVTIQASQLDDMVLLRSNGTPTYMHAVVCDDIDMEITHIIRGEDHLINAFRQSYLYHALGEKTPIFAHLPLLHGSDGTKLSKRHGATGISQWKEMGYMPEMILNYLISLGWNDLDQDVFSLADAVQHFNLEKVNNSAARVDYAKMNFLSGLYLRGLGEDEFIERFYAWHRDVYKNPLTDDHLTVLKQAASLFIPRIATFKEFSQMTDFLITDQKITPDTKATELLGIKCNITHLGEVLKYFQAITEWNSENITHSLKQFLAEFNLKMPNIGPVIRAAIAGTIQTPDLASVLVILGQQKTLTRIDRIIAKFSDMS